MGWQSPVMAKEPPASSDGLTTTDANGTSGDKSQDRDNYGSAQYGYKTGANPTTDTNAAAVINQNLNRANERSANAANAKF